MRSRNVSLTFADTSPRQDVEKTYGGFHGLRKALVEKVSVLEGYSKQREPFPSEELVHMAGILDCLKRYSALGPRPDEEATESFCDFVAPLTRGIKLLLQETERSSSEAYSETIDALLTTASQCVSNCAEGVTRRSPDTLFEISELEQLYSHCPSCRDVKSIRVCVGYDDYCSGETGARLWAGEVGLSLYLTENFHSLFLPRLNSDSECCCRLIEIGCGTGLASLTLAKLFLLHGNEALTPSSTPRTEHFVTDVSSSVVEQVRRSFAERNGGPFSRLLDDGAGTLLVTPKTLDMKAVPVDLLHTFHFVFAGDIVYDYTIASFILPCFSSLLLCGGTAILCCEAHRDGMDHFCASIKSEWADVFDVLCLTELGQTLSHLEMINSLTQSHCVLIVLTRK